jgi:hypothetical protein
MVTGVLGLVCKSLPLYRLTYYGSFAEDAVDGKKSAFSAILQMLFGWM